MVGWLAVAVVKQIAEATNDSHRHSNPEPCPELEPDTDPDPDPDPHLPQIGGMFEEAEHQREVRREGDEAKPGDPFLGHVRRKAHLYVYAGACMVKGHAVAAVFAMAMKLVSVAMMRQVSATVGLGDDRP